MTARLAELLHESRQLGFLGPGPVEDHISHAAAFGAVVDQAPARALDLGAGGGLPGLVLAATTWPETHWCFLDAQERRIEFLDRAVAALGLASRVDLVLERAEVVGREPGHRGAYDLVVARSFGAPPVTAECAAPLLRVGGALVVSEPPTGAWAERWPAAGLALLGFGPAEPRAATELADEPVHLVRIELVEAVPDRYPRRVGVPAKRPLF